MSEGSRGFAQEIGGFDIQRSGQSVDHIDAGTIDTALQRTDIGSINVSAMSQLFLRQSPYLPVFLQIECKDLSDLHGPDMQAL